MKEIVWAALVPELTCTNLSDSKRFYCDLLGFSVLYERPEDDFAYLGLGPAQIMLEQEQAGGWTVGPLDRPFGRGLNLQIEVETLGPICDRLRSASIALYREPKEVWYRQDDVDHGQIEMLVQDPDGFLLRFVEVLGLRSVPLP